MSSTSLGQVQTCLFGKRLILALDEKWSQRNNGKPLIFDVKIQDGKLVLEAEVSQ